MTKKEKYGEFIKQMYIYDITKTHVARRARVSRSAVSRFFSMQLISKNVLQAILSLIEEKKEERHGK